MVRINIANAQDKMMQRLAGCLGHEGEWLEEYDGIADWLSDSLGQGLILSGSAGRGKTLLATRAIPAILKAEGYAVSIYDARDAANYLPQIKEQKIVILDDVGEESAAMQYGNKIDAVAQISDWSEKYRKVLLITTNLGRKEFAAKYGMRTIERLVRACRWIPFSGASLRTSATSDRPITTPDLPPEKPTSTEVCEQGWLFVGQRLGCNPWECFERYQQEKRKLAEDVRNGRIEITSGRPILTEDGVMGHFNGKTILHHVLNCLGLSDEVILNIGYELKEHQDRLDKDDKRREEMAMLAESV